MSLQILMRFENEPLLWLVDNVYTKEECDRFIDFIERSSPTLATNNPLYRDQDRVIKDDPKIAAELFRSQYPYLPQKIN